MASKGSSLTRALAAVGPEDRRFEHKVSIDLAARAETQHSQAQELPAGRCACGPAARWGLHYLDPELECFCHSQEAQLLSSSSRHNAVNHRLC